MREVYQRKGLWYVVGKGRPYKTRAEAEGKKLDPLAELAAKAQVYKSFEDAVADHGEDEEYLVEED